MPNVLSEVEIEKISLVDRGANNKKFFLFKSIEDSKEKSDMANDELEGVQKELADLRKQLEQVDALKKEKEDLQKQFAEAQSDNEKLEKALAEQKANLQKAEEERIQKEYLEKAANYSVVPGISVEELAQVLRSDNEPVITKMLDAVKVLVEKSEAMVEKGSAKAETNQVSAQESLLKRAEEIQKAEGISRADAIIKAVSENPKDYEAHRKSIRSVRGAD